MPDIDAPKIPRPAPPNPAPPHKLTDAPAVAQELYEILERYDNDDPESPDVETLEKAATILGCAHALYVDLQELWAAIEQGDTVTAGPTVHAALSAADQCDALYALLGRHGMPVS